MNLKEGTILQNGKYKILRVLGRGGFGITYLVENTLMEKQYAIKEFFPRDFCKRAPSNSLTLPIPSKMELITRLKRRFLKEARNIAHLDHPGIIRIHDVFEENDTAYYVMDYIEGRNLNQFVKQGGITSELKAVDYICEVADAVEYVHSRRMAHYDIKPSNIMVNDATGRLVLIDFGLSRQFGEDNTPDSSNTTNVNAASQGYSPPEIYDGKAKRKFIPQTDIYSLGATLYFMLTGVVPPSAQTVMEEGLSITTFVSPEIRDVISKSMRPRINDRHQTVGEFRKELEKVRSQLGKGDIPDPPNPPPRNPVDEEEDNEEGGNGTMGWIIGAAIVVVVLAVSLFVVRAVRDGSRRNADTEMIVGEGSKSSPKSSDRKNSGSHDSRARQKDSQGSSSGTVGNAHSNVPGQQGRKVDKPGARFDEDVESYPAEDMMDDRIAPAD